MNAPPRLESHLQPMGQPGPAALHSHPDVLPNHGVGLLADLVRTLGGCPAALSTLQADWPLATCRVHQGSTLFLEGATVQALHVLRAGAVKCLRTSEDGYEHVLALADPGDVLGFEALHSGTHSTSAVALEDSSAFVLPLHGLRELRMAVPVLDHALQQRLSRQLARAGDLSDIMAAVAADAKLARFLLWQSARAAEAGQSPRRLHLRMCRRDLASLMGVAHETVSRGFSVLAEAGLVQVHNRDVEILDTEGLQARARCTRGASDDTTASTHHAHQTHHNQGATCAAPRPGPSAAPLRHTRECVPS